MEQPMQFEISAEEMAKAKVPHELFLTNLVGNHILWFVASLGIFGSFWQPMAMVPVISLLILGYTLLRARRERNGSSWYVMCHWQIVARRSLVFMGVIMLLIVIASLGWIGYSYLGMKKVAVLALIGGAGLLPTLVSVLILIVMESDAMYQASQGKLSDAVYQRFPNPDARILEDAALDLDDNKQAYNSTD
tara:strand:- start:10460 stop:11032 length:573 start_codon:yes stop_codon:yes gene_type:complete